MNVFSKLRTHLLSDAAIVALVSQRIYPVKVPQGATYPLITIQQISGFRHALLRGRASLASPRFQIDCWTKEASGTAAFLAVRTLGELVIAKLEGFTDTWIDDSVSPSENRLVAIQFDSDRDLFETDVSGGFYRHSADYFITYQTR